MSAVVEDPAVPVGVKSLAAIGVLVETGAVELRQTECVARKMRRHPIEDDPDAVLMQHVDQVHQVLRSAITRVGAK